MILSLVSVKLHCEVLVYHCAVLLHIKGPQQADHSGELWYWQWCRLHRAQVPPLLQMAGHGEGTMSRTANKKLTKPY